MRAIEFVRMHVLPDVHTKSSFELKFDQFYAIEDITDMLKWQIQKIVLNDSSDQTNGARGPTFLQLVPRSQLYL